MRFFQLFLLENRNSCYPGEWFGSERAEKRKQKKFLRWGVAATRWKGSIRTRKSKEIKAFFFDFLCAGFAGFGWIWICLGNAAPP